MARRIISDPEIILLDEPFSALDSYLKWKISKELFSRETMVDKLYVKPGKIFCLTELSD